MCVCSCLYVCMRVCDDRSYPNAHIAITHVYMVQNTCTAIHTHAYTQHTHMYDISNYAMSINPFAMAKEKGYDQVLWLFGRNHQVTEVGTMNLFVLWKLPDGMCQSMFWCELYVCMYVSVYNISNPSLFVYRYN